MDIVQKTNYKIVQSLLKQYGVNQQLTKYADKYFYYHLDRCNLDENVKDEILSEFTDKQNQNP